MCTFKENFDSWNAARFENEERKGKKTHVNIFDKGKCYLYLLRVGGTLLPYLLMQQKEDLR